MYGWARKQLWWGIRILSIIIPVLNEADNIRDFLLPLQKYRHQSLEIILVDGGSEDETLAIAKSLCDVVLTSPKGRAKQMNAGAKKSKGNVLLFLHADTLLPKDFLNIIENELSVSTSVWGRFDVRLSGHVFSLRIVEFFMNFRSRWTKIATGDQAIFVRSDIFFKIGGYQDIPLMEDIAFSVSLKKISNPLVLKHKVITSSRRREAFGVWKTIFLMWRLRILYFFNISPHYLAAQYEKK